MGLTAACALCPLVLASVVVATLVWTAWRSLVFRHQRVMPTTPDKGDQADTIVLHDFPKNPAITTVACSLSPYVTKLEAFLRFAGLPYSKARGLPGQGPARKHKLPWIQHGPNVVEDSELVIGYLGRTYGGKVQAAIQPADAYDAGVATAVNRMVEHHLILGLSYYRVIDDAGWSRTSARMFQGDIGVPAPILVPTMALFKRRFRVWMARYRWAQGIGRHSEADQRRLFRADLAALASIMGDKPYLVGDRPYAVDASAFGVLDQAKNDGLALGLASLLAEFPSLEAYVERIRTRYFEARPAASRTAEE